MKIYQIVFVFALIALMAIVSGDVDTGAIAGDCKGKFNLSAADELDIQYKKFTTKNATAIAFFDCFCTGAGFIHPNGSLNENEFAKTAGNNATMASKFKSIAIGCNKSQSPDKKQKTWDNSKCYFTELNKYLNSTNQG